MPSAGWFLTFMFLLSIGVMNKTFYCLASKDVKQVLVCADPPSKKELSTMLKAVMYSKAKLFQEPFRSSIPRTAKLVKKKRPDLDWMLSLMG